MAELEILRTNCARSEIEMPKKAPQHFSSDLVYSQFPSKTSLPNVNRVPLDTSITLVGPWGRPGGHMVVGCQTHFADFFVLEKN